MELCFLMYFIKVVLTFENQSDGKIIISTILARLNYFLPDCKIFLEAAELLIRLDLYYQSILLQGNLDLRDTAYKKSPKAHLIREYSVLHFPQYV